MDMKTILTIIKLIPVVSAVLAYILVFSSVQSGTLTSVLVLLAFFGFVFFFIGRKAAKEDKALKILGTLCCQWFFLRISRNRLVQAIPMMIAGILAVWGFFLYLTSPSWLHATFSNFVSDYALYLLICLGVMLLKWLIPRIWRSIRKAIRENKRKKKEATPPPRGYAKQKKTIKGDLKR